MMDLLKFKHSLNQHCGVKSNERILVGVSGGSDSMALLNLLQLCDNEVSVAHFNFMLRGDESDDDESFVREYCNAHQLTLFVKKFDTAQYAKAQGISIEMAARELRYKWFEELCVENGIDWIAVGHHLDDNIETFFINLIRGTGMRGLAGMSSVNGRVIRPLLQFSRHEIIDYCDVNKLMFRTDSSNAESKFVRNKIRNQIIPVIESINPSFSETMQDNMTIYNAIELFVKQEIALKKDELIVGDADAILIPISLLNESKSPMVVLHELIADKGFNSSQIRKIAQSLVGNPGKQFFSDRYRLIRDRHNLILTLRSTVENEECFIESDIKLIEQPIRLQLKMFEKPDGFQISKDENCVHIDMQYIDFPLRLRHWKQGDQFRPLGMKHFKKLSDYFIDEKFSLIEKENSWLLLNNEDIVWIVGNRLDDRYKISSSTKYVLEISYTR